MMHYPEKAQVERAIVRVRQRGDQPTAAAIADEIERGCGLRPGDDVTAMLLEHFEITPTAAEYAPD